MKRLLILATIATLLVACGKQIPQNFKESDKLPNIYPDYTNVTVPINIAPLAFQIDGKADDVVARLTAGTTEIICGGSQIQPDADDVGHATSLSTSLYRQTPSMPTSAIDSSHPRMSPMRS